VEHYRFRIGSTSREIALRDRHTPPSTHRALSAIIVDDGISLKGPGGNVAPGCTDVGPGLAIARPDGAYDFEALARCTAKIHAEAGEAIDSVEVTASDGTNFETIESTIEAVARDYPRITLTI
jgi:hypothetical protein